MTHGFPTGAHVSFLAEPDLIDQLRGLIVPRREPGDVDTCEVALQSFDERHEIPDRKDVRFHKDPQMLDIVDLGKHRMFDHPLPHEVDIDGVVRSHFAHWLRSYMYS